MPPRHDLRYADLFAERTVGGGLVRAARAGRAGSSPAPLERRVREGVAVHGIGDGAPLFASAEGVTPEALGALCRLTGEVVEGLPRLAEELLSLSGEEDAGQMSLPPDAPEEVSETEKRYLVEAALEAAYSAAPRAAHVEAAYREETRRTWIVNSEGARRGAAVAHVGLRVEVGLEDGLTGVAVAGGPGGFGHFFRHPPEAVAREAVEAAERRRGAPARLPGGVLPVVFAPGWGGVWLHEAVGHLLEADVVLAGRSPYGGRLGDRVAPRDVTLVDDGTVPGGRASAPCDDEGTPAGRTALIEEGVLRAYLTDRRHAALLGARPSGNGRRQDYRHPPLPRMTNLLLEAGTEDAEALLGTVDRGLYVEAIAHGRILPEEDLVLLDAPGAWLIEHGRLAGAVGPVRLKGRASTLLAGVRIGSDARLDGSRGHCAKAGQTVPFSVGAPTVRVDGLEAQLR